MDNEPVTTAPSRRSSRAPARAKPPASATLSEGPDTLVTTARTDRPRGRRPVRRGGRAVSGPPQLVYETGLGRAWLGDSLELLDDFEDDSINLVCTSPPFALTRQKAYGNEPEDEYVAWFRKFADRVMAKLADDGS